MNRKKINLLLIVLLGLAALPAAQADTLDDRLRLIERKFEILEENQLKEKTDGVTTKAGKDGFVWQSNDGNYRLRLRGYAHFDTRSFFDDVNTPATSGFLFRRLRPGIEVNAGKNISFRFLSEFAGTSVSFLDAFVDLKAINELKLRFGKFKPPVGIERLQSGTNMAFIERALPTNLVPNRDLGIQLFGDIGEGLIDYSVGAFNGTPDGGNLNNDADDNKDLVARIFTHPFRVTGIDALSDLGLGYAVSEGDQFGTGYVAALRTPGQETFFSYLAGTTANGSHGRTSPQLYYYLGQWGLLAEWVNSSQTVRQGANVETLTHQASAYTLSYVLTGENNSFAGIKPYTEFNWENGTWGAIELVARVSELTIDTKAFPLFANPVVSAQKASSTAYGLNWHLNKNLKWSADYETTIFTGGATGGNNRETEKVLFTRFQLAF